MTILVKPYKRAYSISRNFCKDLIGEVLQLAKIVFCSEYIPLGYNVFYNKLIKIAKIMSC